MSLSPEDMRRVGGSDVAAILGLSRYAGPLVPYLRIVEGIQSSDNDAMASGRDLEPVVIAQYARKTGHDYQTSIRLHGLRPHERASLDAIAYVADRSRVVEAKTASWRSMDGWGEPGTDDIPQEYLLQVQWYMGSLREDQRVRSGTAQPADGVADVPALIGGEFGIWQVAYDPDIYGHIREAVARFWRDHVEKRVPPEPTALSSDAEFIRKRFPRHREKALEWGSLTEQQRFWLEAHREGKAHIRELERALETSEARIKMLLGEHDGVTGFVDGSRLTWRQDKPSFVTDWEAAWTALSERHGLDRAWLAEILKQHTTTREGRRPLVWRERKAK